MSKMLLLELEDSDGPIDEKDLAPGYWWLLVHPGIDVETLFHSVTGRYISDFSHDRNARAATAAGLDLLCIVDEEMQEEERPGLEEKLAAPEPWFDPGEFLPLARTFIGFLRDRPACTEEPFFEGLSDFQATQHADAQPIVVKIYGLLVEFLKDARRRGVRFRFTGPKGRAEMDHYWKRGRKLSDAWWSGDRRGPAV